MRLRAVIFKIGATVVHLTCQSRTPRFDTSLPEAKLRSPIFFVVHMLRAYHGPLDPDLIRHLVCE